MPSFHLVADVSSASPDGIRAVVAQLFPTGVTETAGGFHVEAVLEGESAATSTGRCSPHCARRRSGRGSAPRGPPAARRSGSSTTYPRGAARPADPACHQLVPYLLVTHLTPYHFGSPPAPTLHRPARGARADCRPPDRRQNVILHGPRRYGKTSLLHRAIEAARKRGGRTGYVNLLRCSSRREVAQAITQGIFSGPLHGGTTARWTAGRAHPGAPASRLLPTGG